MDLISRIWRTQIKNRLSHGSKGNQPNVHDRSEFLENFKVMKTKTAAPNVKKAKSPGTHSPVSNMVCQLPLRASKNVEVILTLKFI
jgi:hypothetical protein